MIYFAQGAEGGPIKIGYSEDVDARIRQLEAHYGQLLVLLATMPGDQQVERQIHERFAELRFGRTEQFRPGADLMDFIGRPLFANATPVQQMACVTGKIVRLADDVITDARTVAAIQGVSLSDYLSDRLRPIVKQDLADQTKKRLER